jgi:hypothetical protein
MATHHQSHSTNHARGNSLEAAMADPTERWQVTKGSLDYGPYTLAQVVEQIRADGVVPGNLIINNDTGERHFAEEHPFFGPLVEEARQTRDDNRRAHAEISHARTSRRRGLVLVSVIGAGVLGLGLVAYVIVGKAGQATEDTHQGISAVGAGTLEAKISFPKQAEPRKARSGGGGGTGPKGDDTLALDMGGEDGGSERLSNDQINGVLQSGGGKLGRCLAQNGGGYAKIEFIVDGPSGKVSWVKVNGQQDGGLYGCLNKAMRTLKFPTVNGPRTRAEFDMQI